MLHGPRCHPTFWLLITALLTSLTAYAEDEVASADTAQPALNSPDSPDSPSAGSPRLPIPAIRPTLVESTTTNTSEALLQRLTQYINQQQYDLAYQLSSDQLAQLEGDPTFDFNYGFSAAQTGRYNEALFVFERLTSEYPGVPRYRLELARCYYYLGQLDNADTEFRRVQAINPPAQVQQTISLFLDRIAEQRQRFHSNWAAAVSYSAGYDSNINSATDIDQIDIILNNQPATVVLNEEQTETSSGFYKLNGNVSYRTPLTKRSGLALRLGGQRKANASSNDYDLNATFIDGDFQLLRGVHRFNIGAGYRHYWLAEESLVTTPSAHLGWHYQLTNPLQLKSRVELRENDNKLNNDLDATQLELSSMLEFGREQFNAQAGIMFSTEFAGDSPLAKDTLGLNLSGQYLLNTRSTLYALLYWRQNDYQNNDDENLLSNGNSRSESLLQTIIGFNRSLISNVSAFAQFTYMDNQSNIDIYQYDRYLIEGGLTLSF